MELLRACAILVAGTESRLRGFCLPPAFSIRIGVCRPNRGDIVLQSDVAPFNAQCAAAVRIQAAARGFRARLYAASRLNWFIYNQLDNDDEKVYH